MTGGIATEKYRVRRYGPVNTWIHTQLRDRDDAGRGEARGRGGLPFGNCVFPSARDELADGAQCRRRRATAPRTNRVACLVLCWLVLLPRLRNESFLSLSFSLSLFPFVERQRED